MRIATIFLRHGAQKYLDSQVRIDEIFVRQLPGIGRETIVVDTALQPGYVEIRGPQLTILGADNSSSEFSGWDHALSWIGPAIWSFDLVHFATSACFTLYVGYLERFDLRLLRRVVGRPVCVGHIDCYNEPVRLLSYASQHWIRTAFFFLPPAEVKALGSLVSLRESKRIFSGDATRPFRDDAPLSENYRRYIFDWITGGDIGQGVTWHSVFRLTQETLPEFERKALAILNEHLFSIRLRALRCRVVDATWLWTQLAQEDREVNWALGWREQLATRGVDAVLAGSNTDLVAASNVNEGDPVS
jgi:hypothetical protein